MPKRNRATQKQLLSQNLREKYRQHIRSPPYKEVKPLVLSSKDIMAKLQNSLGFFRKLLLEIQERIYENLHEKTLISINALNPNLYYRTLISINQLWLY